MRPSQNAHMLLGALVADAASLGVHWIYDPDRISEIAENHGGSAAFIPPMAAHYDGVPSYFAHGARKHGALTQYGENLWLTITSMVAQGGAFDIAAYQADFVAMFGPGGRYCGYIDRPTRGALENITAEKTPSGIDDDQLPAVSRLPALIATYANDDRDAMQITNINTVANQYSDAFKDLLTRLQSGDGLHKALTASAQSAHTDIRNILQGALDTTDNDSTAYGGETGRACHLPMAGPLIFHILKHAANFQDAVERNNRAGGDSAGRAIIIGAAAALAFGSEGDTGIPLSWILEMENAKDIWAQCQALADIAPD